MGTAPRDATIADILRQQKIENSKARGRRRKDKMGIINRPTGSGIAGSRSYSGIRETVPVVLPEVNRIKELGSIQGNLGIDFNFYSTRELFATLAGDVAITFANAPQFLGLIFELTIGTDKTPTLSVAGTAIDLAVYSPDAGEVIEVVVKSQDHGKTLVSFRSKKKADVDVVSGAPSIPRKLYPHGISPSAVRVEWLAPENSGAGLKYEMRYSKFRSTDANGNPNGADANTVSGIITLEATIPGLDANTIYHFWVRATDDAGSSGWAYNYTNTDPDILTAASLDFKVIPGYLSNFLAWKQPAGRSLKFSVYRINPDGSHTSIIAKASNLTITDHTDIKPSTPYTYYMEIFDETGGILPLDLRKQIITLPIPQPANVLISTTGTNLHVSVDIPAFVNGVDVEISLYNQKESDGSYSYRPVTASVSRLLSDGITNPTTKVFTKEQLNTSTQYFVHVRSNHFNRFFSSWTADIPKTTGRYLAPYAVSSLSVKVPTRGQITMKWRSRGDYRGETYVITRYQQGKLGSVVVGSSIRGADPRDKDSRPDRVEISFAGQPTSGTWVYVVTPVNDTGVGAADTYAVNFR